MTRLLLLLLFASPVLGQTSVSSGGTKVIGAPGASSVAAVTCTGGKVLSAISAAGVATCVAAGGTAAISSTSNILKGVSGGGAAVPANGSDIMAIAPVASNAQGGVLSAADHSALAGISPMGMESSGTALDGLHALFANSTKCPLGGTIPGCTGFVPRGYRYGIMPPYGPYGWLATGLNGRGQNAWSTDGGQFRHYCNDPVVTADNSIPTCLDIEDVRAIGNDQAAHTAFNLMFVDTAPGLNAGSVDSTMGSAYPGWTQRSAINWYARFQSSGIHQGYGFTMLCASPGDCNNYGYLSFLAGWRAPADEGVQMDAGHLNQFTSQYKGRPTAITGDTITTTPIGGSFSLLGEGGGRWI